MLKYNPNLNINSTDAEKYAAFVEAVVDGKVKYFIATFDKTVKRSNRKISSRYHIEAFSKHLKIIP